MTGRELEEALRDLPARGRLVKDRPYRQVWRFEHSGRSYYLKFYPRAGGWWKRVVRGSPAMREFSRLQWLQQSGLAAPRAVAVLIGFRLAGRVGDLVVLEAIEPAVALDEMSTSVSVSGKRRRGIAAQVVEIVRQMGAAKLGHSDLHLGNFLVRRDDDRVFLIDAYAVRRGGLRTKDLLLLGHSAAGMATRTELVRGWRRIAGEDVPMPRRNPLAPVLWRRVLQRIWGGNRYFGRLAAGDWRGVFFREAKVGKAWSAVSGKTFDEAAWQTAWERLSADIEGDRLTVLKRSRSGDVLGGEVVNGGEAFAVVVKRPRRRYWYRYLNEVGRGGRARRAWGKAWKLIVRDIPTAWPMLLMERRAMGYVTDAVIVFERVDGETLAKVDLDAMQPGERETLFHRVGATLRKLEAGGLYHWDAKASNFMVTRGDAGPMPVLVDVDGIRGNWGVGEGMRRLLISMREHAQYTPADSLALCRGYAPFSPIRREEELVDGADATSDAVEEGAGA